MIELFYKDKVIIFDSKNNDNSQKDAIFEDYPTVDFVMKRIEDTKSLHIVSRDEKEAFSHFEKEFNPITAAGGVVENRKGEILMIFRNERWDFPKGKLEKGEVIEECAVREVEEETGIRDITITSKPIVTMHIYNIYGEWDLKRTYWYKMFYHGEDDLVFTPQEIEGITKCEWLSEMKAETVTQTSYATIRYVFDKLRFCPLPTTSRTLNKSGHS